MGLGGVLQQLKNEDVLRVFHDYRAGTLYDYSGNGNNGVITNGYLTKKGALLRPITGAITIPYNVGYVAPSISMILGISLPLVLTQDRLVDRRDGVTSTFDWHFNTPSMTVYQEISNKSINLPTVPINALAIDMPAGAAMLSYVNGIYHGVYTGVTNLIASNNPIVIGNIINAQCLTNKIIRYFVYVTRPLTATEHQAVYQQLQALS